jgi:hypothetical protein
LKQAVEIRKWQMPFAMVGKMMRASEMRDNRNMLDRNLSDHG